MRTADVLIIGAGAAGLAAAVTLKENGVENVLLVDRQDYAGGILFQCIHSGFGLHRFGEELTGPEYAQRYIDQARRHHVAMLLSSHVVDILCRDTDKEVIILSQERGLVRVHAKAIILAMGCRERNRGNINIPGSRPAGIFTAGFVQKLVNLEGYMPGREFVIIGSGDIGLIMARRLTLEGADVRAVLEIQPYPGGLQRNVVQCLDDFDIPLYTSHVVTKICGGRRVQSVEVSEILPDGRLEPKMKIPCDTLLLSVGLIPENELSLRAGVSLHPASLGPVVGSDYMTRVSGIFACGNVLHVHDLVDYVSEEASACADAVAAFLAGRLPPGEGIAVHSGNMVRYVVPSSLKPISDRILKLRPVAPMKNTVLKVSGDNGEELFSKQLMRALPSEMITISLPQVPAGCKSITVYFQV
jgi:NADPH-dependent 2,4-dienoyl-CoA reductase/sulfur reductase-like enzyme